MKKSNDNPSESFGSAFNKCLRFLSFRSRSTKEIQDYLLKRGVSQKVIDNVIKRLTELNLLSDEKFARSWIEERQRNKGKSKFALKLELIQKGLDKDAVEEFLNEAQEDFEVARKLFEKKKDRLKGLSKLELKKKMASFLQRRGFSWEIISQLFKEN